MAKAYNPNRDIVAGRTAAQIERAKRMAVGGKKKRCVKGKSCSAACIAASKVCLVDIPWVVAEGIPKVRDRLLKLSQKPVKPSDGPKSLNPRSSDRPSLRKEIEDYNKVIKNIRFQAAAGNLNAEGKEYLNDLVTARRKALKLERSPEAKKEREKLDKEGPEFQLLNKRLKSAERQVEIQDNLIPVLLERRNKEQIGSEAWEKRNARVKSARDLRRLLWNEIDKIEKEKTELKKRLKPQTPPPPKSSLAIPSGLSWQGINAMRKLKDIYVDLKSDSTNIIVNGVALAKDLNWKAFRDPGAERLGKPGAYGAFIKVSGERLSVDLNIKGSFPEGVGIKGGRIGVSEAQIIRRVGEAGLGPRLIAARMSSKFSDTTKRTRNGLLAMSVVPGKDLFSPLPSGISQEQALAAFWKARADLHRMGIAHNDMHPGNIMMDSSGKVRFVDFGLAQASRRAALIEAVGAATNRDWQVNRWAELGGDAAGVQAAAYFRVKENWKRLKDKMEADGISKSDINALSGLEIRQSPSNLKEGIWENPLLTDRRIATYIDILYEGV